MLTKKQATEPERFEWKKAVFTYLPESGEVLMNIDACFIGE